MILLTRNKDYEKSILTIFSYYFSPTWSQSFLKISEHSKLNTYIKIYDLCFEKFNKTYKNFIFQTYYENHELWFFLSLEEE